MGQTDTTEVCAATRPARFLESLCTAGTVIYLKRHNKCALGILGRQDLCPVFGGLAESFEERWAEFGQVGLEQSILRSAVPCNVT